VTEKTIATTSPKNATQPDAGRHGHSGGAPYFVLAVLGLSFWFFVGLPFASHRETYAWLAGVQKESLVQQFAFGLSSTYRPLSQVVTRLGFQILDPTVFPTNVFRQALLQVFVYGMFILAWWLIYSVAPHRRLFALVAFVGGGVFFSGYVHLFHIYGMFYIPVILTLGTLLYLYERGTFQKREVLFALAATVFAFWHPFATGLFIGFYFGFYLDTFRQRNVSRHVQAIAILVVGMVALAALVAIFPRAHMQTGNRLFGFLVSYQTNEVNRIASFAAFVLTQMVVLSILRPFKLRLAGVLGVTALSAILVSGNIPLLLLWFGAVLVKLFILRRWSLFFLMLTAVLLPFGGGIGTPIYGLFAIIVAIYATCLDWPGAESALAFFSPRYAMAIIAGLVAILMLIRAGIDVPVVTRVAMPLLTERERTYQLENALAWLHTSEYCSYDIAFTENSGSPVDSVDNVITRRNRPPAALEDVRFFWNSILRCGGEQHQENGTTLVTFGGPPLGDSSPVFVVKGRYADDAIVWVPQIQKP
jgi:hypothetical protein